MKNKRHDKVYTIWCVAVSGASILLLIGNSTFSLTRLLVAIALLIIVIVVEIVHRKKKGVPPSDKVGD